METEAAVVVERSGSTATLRLNRADQGNAISLALAQDLNKAAQSVAADASIRCVMLTGSGRFFCVGGDIASFGAAGDDAMALMVAITDELHAAIITLAEMPKPLITAVNGSAAGAGLGLAMLGDLVIASATAHFTMAYTAIGLTPDGGTSWLLPRLIGLRRAQEMALTNRRVSADEAERIGLVTRTMPSVDEALAEAGAIAARLSKGATGAMAGVRELLLSGQDQGLSGHLQREATVISAAVGQPEGIRGISAFLSKTKPDFVNA